MEGNDNDVVASRKKHVFIIGILIILIIALFIAELTTSEMLVNMSSSTLEEYYPAVAIATLMRIIRDPTLSQHHTMVVQVWSCTIFLISSKFSDLVCKNILLLNM